MGSGAFLVAACRYLAERLQEAWTGLGAGEWTAFGNRRDEAPDEPPVPADPLEREQLARRLVAERCLYGVDKNPMAVEMAKLSLWLITLARNQPFSFVDHALRAGDSLLGITDIAQLRVAHLDPKWPRQASLDLGFDEIESAVERALTLRRDLEAFVVLDVGDAERKAELLAAADDALADARLLGDLVVGAALAQLDDADPLYASDVAGRVRTMLDTDAAGVARGAARTELRDLADDWLVEHRRAVGEVQAVEWADREPFHWALEFPEVWERGGFDAIVGNPPFQGGTEDHGRARRTVPRLPRDVARRRGGARQMRPRRVLLPARVAAVAAAWRFWTDRDEHARAGRHPGGRAGSARGPRHVNPSRYRKRAVAGRREPRDGDGVGAARGVAR